MAKLSGSAISEALAIGDIEISPFNEVYLGPNSYDLTLGPNLKCYKQATVLDVKKNNVTENHIIGNNGHILQPNILYLGHSNEWAGSKRYVPCIEGRSSMARLGIQVHLTSGFGDVGYVGEWTLEIIVVQPVRIYKDIRICQIYFDTLEGEINSLYDGKYNGSKGVVSSKSYKDFIEPESYSMKLIPADPNAVVYVGCKVKHPNLNIECDLIDSHTGKHSYDPDDGPEEILW